MVKFLNSLNFRQLSSDSAIFCNERLIIAVYVDDILIIGEDLSDIEVFKKQIGLRFKTKDLGRLNYILGIKVENLNENVVKINQKGYIERMIEKYGVLNSKDTDIPIQPNHKLTCDLISENEMHRKVTDVTKYQQVIGSLIYLMTCTRPDISYSVGILSRFMKEPRELHWRFLKRLLKYVKTTKDYSLVFTKNEGIKIDLIGYTGSDYAGDLEDRKSTSGYLFCYKGCLVSWNSSKQKTVSLSSTEIEYIALANAAKEALWLKQLLNELNKDANQTLIYCDNKSTICLAKNPEMHSRTKHIDIR